MVDKYQYSGSINRDRPRGWQGEGWKDDRSRGKKLELRAAGSRALSSSQADGLASTANTLRLSHLYFRRDCKEMYIPPKYGQIIVFYDPFYSVYPLPPGSIDAGSAY